MTETTTHSAAHHGFKEDPGDESFIERIFRQIAQQRGKAFVTEVRGNAPVSITGEDLLALIAAGRASLRGHNVQKNDRVVLVADNSAQWIAVDLATQAEGATLVPFYTKHELGELTAMIEDARPSLIVTGTDELAASLRARWSQTEIVTQADLLRSSQPVSEAPVPRRPEDICTIVYTSGTSGEPKGAMLSVANVDTMLAITSAALERMMQPHQASSRSQSRNAGQSEEERVFHYLPLCFAGSRIVLWTMPLPRVSASCCRPT